MIVKPGFFTHPKTLKLIELAGTELAMIWLQKLWAHCELCKSCTFQNLKNVRLMHICGVRDRHIKLREILTLSGFLREEGDTTIVHDWDVVNARLIASWRNGQRGGRPSDQKTHGFPRVKTSSRARQNSELNKEENSKNPSSQPNARRSEDEDRQLSVEEIEANHQKFAKQMGELRRKFEAGEQINTEDQK